MNRKLPFASLSIASLAALAVALVSGGGKVAERSPEPVSPTAAGTVELPSPSVQGSDRAPDDAGTEASRVALTAPDRSPRAAVGPREGLRLVPLGPELVQLELSFRRPGTVRFSRPVTVGSRGEILPWPRWMPERAELRVSTRRGFWSVSLDRDVVDRRGVATIGDSAERRGIARIRLFDDESTNGRPLGESDAPLPRGTVVRLVRADGHGAEHVVEAGEPTFDKLTPGVYEVRAWTPRHHAEVALLRVEPGAYADLDLRLRKREDLVDLRIVLRAKGGRDALLADLVVEAESGPTIVWTEGSGGLVCRSEGFSLEPSSFFFPPSPRDLAEGVVLTATELPPGKPTIRLDTDARHAVTLRRDGRGAWVAEVEWDESDAVERYGTWSMQYAGEHGSPEDARKHALTTRYFEGVELCEY